MNPRVKGSFYIETKWTIARPPNVVFICYNIAKLSFFSKTGIDEGMGAC